jgi:hypothetical protein
MKTRTILIFVGAVGLMFGPDALAQHAQTVSSPPAGGGNQSTSSGKNTQSKSTFTQAPSNKSASPRNARAQHQAGKKGYHGSGHGGGVEVGISATIDLSGIGQRRAEPDPFAVPAAPQPVAAHKEEKPLIARKPREIAKTDPFAALQLTGPKAKEAASSSAAVDQTAETNPFASVDLTTAKAKDFEKQKELQ